jgi:5'(3')-deoxyribonucleotidase
MSDQIRELKEKLIKEKRCGLALDVDNTLADTSIVWVEKIAAVLGNPEGLTMKEFTEKYGYGRGVSYWAEEEYEKVSMKMRSSEDLYESLPLIENASKQVNEINKIVPISAYVTARNMEITESTKKWLKKHGFPELEVICRPDELHVMEQFKWKAEFLEKMYPEIWGIVDDSSRLIDALSKDYKGTVFLYGKENSERKDIKVIKCKNWETVAKKIKESIK